jgi:hypothetical protein
MARTVVAIEGARMKTLEPSPPRWAEALLRSLLRPADNESISGDLLEEYRAARHPALGTRRANAWYIKHVLSILWRLIWPCALAVATVTLLSLKMKGLWYGSLVQAPGVSLLDALIYLWAGYHGSQRTRLIRTGIVTAGSTSLVGFTTLCAAVAIGTPNLLKIPFVLPAYLLILSALALTALGYGIVLGFVGGYFGRWASALRQETRVS